MRVLLRACLVGSCMFLAACGGGGGGSPDPTPTPTPPPPSGPPPPSDSTSPFNTVEFQANWGLNEVNALAAYDDGLTGAGAVIGIIDTGIDVDQTELDANVHPASKDIHDGTVNTLNPLSGGTATFTSMRTGGASLDDIDGHGTFVAGLIAAERNNNRMHGLAFEAQVMALRTDDPGTCDACTFDDNAIAASLNYAVANGADIVNISLGGSAANDNLRGAIQDATAAGVIIVISAGNAEDDGPPYDPPADPDPLAQAALETWANGLVIIAGSSNFSGTISEFSNRAGVGRNFYILAPGEDVYSTGVTEFGDSSFGTGSGTSFSAPVIAAAVALLMEKFPALTPAEIIDILFTSATDVGVAGVDGINGHGLLNLEAAIAPIGTVSVSISISGDIVSADPAFGGLVAGGAFGDGFGQGFQGGAVFTDSYDRAYTTGFEDQIRLASPYVDFLSRFGSAENFETTQVTVGAGSTLAISGQYDRPLTGYEQNVLGMTTQQDGGLSRVKFRMETALSQRTSLSFGLGGSLEDGLDQAGTGGTQGTFLASGAGLPWLSGTGSASSGVMTGGRRYGASHQLDNGYVISVAAGEDDVAAPYFDALSNAPVRDASQVSTVARLGKPYRGGEWAVTFGRVDEVGSVLGSFSSGVLGLGKGAETDFVTLGGQAGIGRLGSSSLSVFGHAAGAAVTIDEDAGSAFSDYKGLTASQFAIGLALNGKGFGGNRISFTLSQPVRLEAGKVVYGFASSYDYDSESLLYDDARRSIVPSGRELDLELAWHLGLRDSARISANILYQREPGHVAGRDDAISFMLTSRSTF